MNDIFVGIDVGSTTVKVVILDQAQTLLAHRYLRSQGQPRQTLLGAVAELLPQVSAKRIAGVGLTGSGGKPVAQLIGGHFVNELVAQTRAVGAYYPEARTVIEIGGQDSKFLSVEWDEASGKMQLVDFAMNTLCAAGTGSFLDQQADRLGISIEEEFGTLALRSKTPARIAGRCTVFAKSDMIHLQQKGTPLPDILAGLCLAMTRNFRSVIGKGKLFVPPILFQGGVAYNQGVVRAFESVLKLEPGQLIVPDHHPLMAALGAAIIALDEARNERLPAFFGFKQLRDNLHTNGQFEQKRMPPLPNINPNRNNGFQPRTGHMWAETREKMRMPVYLGVDVGSISTNAVLVDRQGQVVARRYLYTAGRPLEAVRRSLREIGQEVGDFVDVKAVGVTGSGRYLTGDFVGADVVRNEITAQARAALAIDPAVDTIFEIGGQDSKYIRLDHGTIVDFAMNSACAAGTGSFLEEQADRLRIDLKSDFSQLALASEGPTCLGERCTVFMESDLIHHQQQGAGVTDLTGGLAYSIVQNYLNRVVDGRLVGENIFFQGGVAWNRSVVAAFQKLLGRKVTVPPHHDVTGAIGAALLAAETVADPRHNGASTTTKFRGFDLADRNYEITKFECKACPNLCEINKIVIGGETPIFYGARCDRFEEAGRTQNQARSIPDLFTERIALLLGDYQQPDDRRNGRLRVAVPRTLTFYDMFPFWRTFFDTLDIELVLSDVTNPVIVRQTAEYATAEMCFPAKLVYGHVVNLLEKDLDVLFLPSVVNRENVACGQTENTYCPFIPASAHLVTANVDLARRIPQAAKFPLHMLWEKAQKKEFKVMADELKLPVRQVKRAVAAAETAQQQFYQTLRRRGREVLDGLGPEQVGVVIVGRPYNTCDFGVCQDLPYKLRRLGALPIPMDYLPLDSVDVSDRYDNMFWRSGQDILAAAKIIRDDPRLQAIYLTNFNCGPDSFLINFFREIMAGKSFLELEVDDHTADAGIITRCEAFLESLKMGKGQLV